MSNEEVGGFGFVKHICIRSFRGAMDYKIKPIQNLLCIPAESTPYEKK